MNITLSYVSDIGECANVTCSNRGNCTDGVDTYTCVCEAGYNGTDCEIGRCHKTNNNITVYTAGSIYMLTAYMPEKKGCCKINTLHTVQRILKKC